MLSSSSIRTQFSNPVNVRISQFGSAFIKDIAVEGRPFLEKAVMSGRLIAPFGMDVMKDMQAHQIPGFYLVLPKSLRRVKQISRFCRWVETENWQAS